MKRNLIWIGSLLSLLPLLDAAPAHAGIDACGNISIPADAECRIEVEGGCQAQCTPVAFEAACAGELEVECRGGCDVDAALSCTATCDIATCVASCDIDPPRFECTAECNAQAEARCEGECEANADRRQCEASCKATYSASCDASCEGTPPSASCQAKCEARCEADCSARANVDCQVDCQRDGYLECQARLEGGCEVACERPEGALFCDDQFVQAGRNLQECIGALRSRLDIDVAMEAYASGDCAGNTCSGSADASALASCSYGAPSTGGGAGALAVLLSAAALIGARVRRRRG